MSSSSSEDENSGNTSGERSSRDESCTFIDRFQEDVFLNHTVKEPKAKLIEKDQEAKTKQLTPFLEDLKKLISSPEGKYFLVNIQCSDGENVKACKLILATRSKYFRTLFQYEEKTTLNLPFDSKAVKAVLDLLLFDEKEVCKEETVQEFLVNQKVSLGEMLKTVEFLMIDYLEDVLLSWFWYATKRLLSRTEILAIFEVSFSRETDIFKDVTSICNYYILKKFVKIARSGELQILSEDALVSLFSTALSYQDQWACTFAIKDKCSWNRVTTTVDELQINSLLVKFLHETLKSQGKLPRFEDILNNIGFENDILYCLIMNGADKELYKLDNIFELDDPLEGIWTEPCKIDPSSDLAQRLQAWCKKPIKGTKWYGKFKILSDPSFGPSMEQKMKKFKPVEDWISSFKPVDHIHFVYRADPKLVKQFNVLHVLAGLVIVFQDSTKEKYGLDKTQGSKVSKQSCIGCSSVTLTRGNSFQFIVLSEFKDIGPEGYDYFYSQEYNCLCGRLECSRNEDQLDLERIEALHNPTICGLKIKSITFSGEQYIADLQVQYSVNASSLRHHQKQDKNQALEPKVAFAFEKKNCFRVIANKK